MDIDPDAETIRTRRLELTRVTQTFVQALAARDVAAAEAAIGARLGRSLLSDSSHVVQLFIAEQAAGAAGFSGGGRVIVLPRAGRRQAIGSIGFHGPPDDRGRLEVGCRIQPASRGQGYAAEALSAMLGWATSRFGVKSFVVAVPSLHESWSLVAVDMAIGRRVSADGAVVELATLFDDAVADEHRSTE